MVGLALPIVCSQLGLIAMQTTDVIMLARLGPDYMAAGSLGFAVYFNVWLFCLGILIASASLVAQAYGARDYRGVRRSVRQAFWVALTLALPAMALIWNGHHLLLWAGRDGAVVDHARTYLHTIVWGIPFSLGFLVLRYFVSALSRPKIVMVALIGGALINGLLDYLLIFGHLGFPALGVAGAAGATAAVHVGLFLTLATFVLRDRQFRRFHVFARFTRPDWQRYLEVWRVGLPVGVTVVAESGLFLSAQLLMLRLGTLNVAAHAVALQITAVAFMIPLGVGQAGQVRVGQHFGARDVEGVRRAAWVAAALGCGFMACTATLMWLAPGAVVSLIVDPGDPQLLPVFNLAVSFLVVAALFQIFDGAQAVMSCSLRGLCDTAWPMALAMTGYWGIGFVAAYLLAFEAGLGGIGVWYGLALGLAVVAAALTTRFSLRRRLGLLDRHRLSALPSRAARTET
ncbi:multidrug resistance protein, MATE family [Tistlia consotensis]|uniref:Multidrug-efflux transporter n=2 Tax=Tistlia TaxID=1321364 RepID=A0A1Y6CKI0_9PROT|nr:multidrug resistance protein, MATE family [Tistlia consotensis USBA 355]SNR92883.1 multidrug resistance protein, MATE family [Tistlia consotensis]